MTESSSEAHVAGRPPASAPVGLAIVDKSAGWTSHDVVARSRGLLGTRKIGHAGTLDPSATGVLVLGVGRATRLLRYLGDLTKCYEGDLVLGSSTSTLDADGEVVATYDMTGIALADVVAASRGLTGAIMQVPPMVSAIQVGGRRLYALARAGIEVEREPRPVTIHRLEVEPGDEPGVFRLSVECSTGAYIRSLAADIGTALGGGAHLRNLRRTAIGAFTLDRAVTLEHLSPDRLLPPIEAVGHLAAATVGDDVGAAVGHGKVLPLDTLGVSGAGPWAIVDSGGRLLAVYAAHQPGTAKPDVVLA